MIDDSSAYIKSLGDYSALSSLAHYGDRNRIVLALGFENYDKYLRSPLWCGIRDRVLASKPECLGCKNLANQVHHEKYTRNNLSGASLEFLVPICYHCHQHIEFGRGKTKLTPLQAANRLWQMRTDKSNGLSRPAVDPVRQKRKRANKTAKKKNRQRCYDESVSYQKLRRLVAQLRKDLRLIQGSMANEGSEAAEKLAAEIIGYLVKMLLEG